MYERRLSVVYLALARRPGTSPPAPSIAAFAFNATTGALTPLAGSPYSSNGATLFPWLHPSGKFLYQVNGSNGTLQRYSIDQTTGVPTLAGDVTTPADLPFVLIADPSGRYAYVTSTAGANVSVVLGRPDDRRADAREHAARRRGRVLAAAGRFAVASDARPLRRSARYALCGAGSAGTRRPRRRRTDTSASSRARPRTP